MIYKLMTLWKFTGETSDSACLQGGMDQGGAETLGGVGEGKRKIVFSHISFSGLGILSHANSNFSKKISKVI